MARKSDVAEVEWKILNEIENGDKTTQRNLSQKLDLALGAVNFHLKRLVRKGYIKMKTMPPNRAIYFVTPSGISRKVRLTYEYMVGTLAFFREARDRSRNLFEQLEEEGMKKVAFLGARDLAEICYLSLQETGLELAGIYDDERAGQEFIGFKVQAEEALENSEADRVIFTKQEWAKRGEYENRPDVVFLF
jgi:DNA-binding MarR family transcriptional regulator